MFCSNKGHYTVKDIFIGMGLGTADVLTVVLTARGMVGVFELIKVVAADTRIWI